MGFLGNLRLRGTKDLNAHKARVMLDWGKIVLRGIRIPAREIICYAEQLLWRIDTCRDCYDAGKCKHCSCDSPGVFIVRRNYCSLNKWPAYMRSEKWEKFKTENGIKIAVGTW